jgi:hypothetical protein
VREPARGSEANDNFTKGFIMDENMYIVQRLNDRIDSLQVWIFILVVLLLISLGWNYYNMRQIEEYMEILGLVKSIIS